MKTRTHTSSGTTGLMLTGLVALMAIEASFGEIPRGYFTDVRNLGANVNTSSHEGAPNISADGLTLYFISNRSGGYGNSDLWQATRPAVNEAFGDVVNLGPGVNGPFGDFKPTISFDGLTLYFRSDRTGGLGSSDIYRATRPTMNEAFGNVMNLGPGINTSFDERPGYVTPDGLTLYFMSDRTGGYGEWDLYVATRENVKDPFANATNLGSEINSPADEYVPSLSHDGLVLFFSDRQAGPDRPGGLGNADLWVAIRPSADAPFGNVVNLNDFSLGSEINGPYHDFNLSVSHDWPASGSQLYFQTDRSGGSDIWQATWVAIGQEVAFVPRRSEDALSDAIADAGPGGKVILASGVHYETTSVLVDIPVTITGHAGAVIKSGVVRDRPPGPFAIAPTLLVSNTHDVVIEGISFEPSQNRAAAGTAVMVDDSPDVVLRDNTISNYQFGVIIQGGDRALVTGNTVMLADDVDARGISSLNGHGVQISGNYVTGGLMGIFLGGPHGQCTENVVEDASLGFVLSRVRDGLFDFSGDSRRATGWYVAHNEAHHNEWGYLVIDGATRNTLVNNTGSGNAMYDLELAGVSERFGFFTPTSSENVVVQEADHLLTIKDCGLNNIVSGNVILVDSETEPCF